MSLGNTVSVLNHLKEKCLEKVEYVNKSKGLYILAGNKLDSVKRKLDGIVKDISDTNIIFKPGSCNNTGLYSQIITDVSNCVAFINQRRSNSLKEKISYSDRALCSAAIYKSVSENKPATIFSADRHMVMLITYFHSTPVKGIDVNLVFPNLVRGDCEYFNYKN
ncbi:MAG: hypothetical protein Q8L29_04215 [archaeon]|nr:hypothetical protein [archaeon]